MANSDEFITIADFRPGIMADHHAELGDPITSGGSSVTVNGAATIDNTYRCCSSADGTLIPLPGGYYPPDANSQRPRPPAATGTANTRNYLPNHDGYYVSDAVLMGPLQPAYTFGLGSAQVYGDEGLAVYVAYTLTFAPGGAVAGKRRVYHFVASWMVLNTPLNLRTMTVVNFKRTNTLESFVDIASAALERTRTTADANDYPVAVQDTFATLAHMWSSVSYFQSGAVGANDDSEIGIAYLATDYAAPVNWYGGVSLIPPALPTTLPYTTYGRANDSQGGFSNASIPLVRSSDHRWMIAHQGRLIMDEGIIAAGSAPSEITYWASIGYDPLVYTSASRPQATLDTTFEAIFVEDNPTAYGAIASMTANDLLLVKNFAGGVLVRGDLENPSVIRLPKIEPTYGVLYHTVVCPLGVVYCSRNGIFAWDNSDTSTHLSPQLDGQFYKHYQPNEYILGIKGRLGYFHPYVCVPNNFILDTRTKSWWRLDMPTYATTTPHFDPFAFYDVSPSSGFLYAFPYKIRAGAGAMFGATLIEPFDNYTAAPWTLNGTPAIAAGRTGTAASLNPSSQVTYTVPAAAQSDYVTMGFAWQISSAAAGARFIALFGSDAGVTPQCRLMHDSTGALLFQRGNGNAVGGTATGLIVINTWYYVEVQFRVHDTLGSVTIRLNGAVVLNLTGVDTHNTGSFPIDSVKLGSQTSGANSLYDDLYLKTGAGATFEGDTPITAGMTVGVPTPPFWIYDPKRLASTFSWQSQPLVETRDRRVDFGQVNLICQAAPDGPNATVKVTLSGFNEDGTPVTSVSETFALAANPNPQHLIRYLHPNFVARYVQVRIEAAATSGPAPKIHSLALGVREDVRGIRA